MDIVIFKDLTTNDYLDQLKVESEKYTGLYVDMNVPEQRKYVKDKAYDIQQLLKKVDRKRIDTSKQYKSTVEKEAADIKERLEIANLPFMLLIDEHKAERAKILSDKKRVEELKELAIKKEDDHELGLLINKTFEFDKSEELRLWNEKQKIIEAAALKKAVDHCVELGVKQEQEKVNAENARLANTEHCAKINRTILACLLDEGFDEHEAKKFIKLAAQNKLPNVTINY